MIIEAVFTAIKGLPQFLAHTVEVILVASMAVFIFLFLFGFWTAIRVVGAKQRRIKEISFVPPKVTFFEDEEGEDNGNV